MKIYKSYNNQQLLDALKDSKDVISDIYELDLSDEELIRVNKYKKLSQFEKDLLYLISQHSVAEVANLYCCSRTHIYNNLKSIQKKLNE